MAEQITDHVTIAALAEALGLECAGDGALEVARAAEPRDAGAGDLALAMSPRFAEDLPKGAARAAMLWEGADWQALGLDAAIFAPRPRLAMAGLTAWLDAGPGIAPGVHPSAVIDPGAQIGAGAAIGPLVVIGAGARIGPNARIGAHVSIGAGAEIGADALIREGVRIAGTVRIGARFIAQPGAVIGGDGFSFVTPEKSKAEAARETMGEEADAPGGQPWLRIHSLGGVVIGDDVEMGANACIDAGTIRPTRIGTGTKIDNLVQVAHNVEVGAHCLLCGQVGIAGSATIGDFTVLGGQVGVVDNIKIGAGVVAGAGTMILSNAPEGRILLGYPAMRMQTHVETYKALRRLPRLAAEVAGLKKRVSKLDEND